MSTYSPNLRLELITNGTQAGGWGNTTNNNLGTLIEAAISGYNTVSITASAQALTANDGGADEARQAVIRLTTTTAAAFAVFVPPSPKQYTFFNDTVYVATVYCSTVLNGTIAGGAGVAIPIGATMTVWSDGTVVRQQNTHFISPTLASPVLGGTPLAPTAVAGTSTTQVATTEFVQSAAGVALQTIYPIGSIYINATNSANPNALFGFGTWAAFGAGRVPVGFDATNPLFDAAQETGGSADAVVVSHTHTATTTFSGGAHTHAGTTASSGVHTHNFGSGNFSTADGPDAPCNYLVADQGQSGNLATATLQGINYLQNAGAHTHTFTTDSATVSGTGTTTVAATGVTGVNQNYQPYITVYMWRRTA